MYGHYIQHESMDLPGEVAHPARGRTGKMNISLSNRVRLPILLVVS